MTGTRAAPSAGSRQARLPRSLAPLPEESLGGFLLRLSHRIDIAPSQLAFVLGIVPSGYMPLNRIIELDENQLHRLAHRARLTIAEAIELTLRPLGSRYQPLDGTRLSSGYTVSQETWVFGTATRYCPNCLAGDGSTIQNEHGGPWNKLWRLPPVFACPAHHRLLRLHCPACGARAHSHNPPGYARLVPIPGVILHPTQCRSGTVEQPCPGRLDDQSAETAPHEASNSLMHYQQQFLALLRGHCRTATSLAAEVTAREYFNDLRLVQLLLRASWNRREHDSALPALLAEADRYLNRHDDRLALDEAIRTPRRGEYGRLDYPPLDPAAAGALLCLAAETISKPEAEAAAVIRSMLTKAPEVTNRGFFYSSPASTALFRIINEMHW